MGLSIEDISNINSTEKKIFKKDITLNINNFNKLNYITDREALARMLQHIVITKKGTYPNNPDFGVGIEDYAFERADSATINEILENVNYQISKWITKENGLYINTDIKFYKSPENKNYVTLILFFEVTRDQDNLKDYNDDDYVITMFVSQNSRNRQILSQIEI